MRHLYENEVTDWYVAESLDEAVELAKKYQVDVGMDPDEMALEFTQTPDSRELSIVDDGGVKTKKTAAQWAAQSEKGFLCSTEF